MGADTSHDAGTQDPKILVAKENDSDDESMRERVLKAIADRDKRSFGSHLEGREGTALVAHEGASVQNEVKREESSQDAMGPSSTNVVANIGT